MCLFVCVCVCVCVFVTTMYTFLHKGIMYLSFTLHVIEVGTGLRDALCGTLQSYVRLVSLDLHLLNVKFCIMHNNLISNHGPLASLIHHVSLFLSKFMPSSLGRKYSWVHFGFLSSESSCDCLFL